MADYRGKEERYRGQKRHSDFRGRRDADCWVKGEGEGCLV